jgi:hypothetical protein
MSFKNSSHSYNTAMWLYTTMVSYPCYLKGISYRTELEFVNDAL